MTGGKTYLAGREAQAMRKVVLTFGLISGAITSLMMFLTLPFADRIGFDRGELIGYASIILSLLMVFFGIRSYRDNVAGGAVTFRKAFAVGLAITVISCICYVVSWEILYYNFMPDFLDKYSAHLIEQAAGKSPEAIQAQVQEVNKLKELYKNPLMNAAITFIEPFPIGLIVTLMSAGILRRKRPTPKTLEP